MRPLLLPTCFTLILGALLPAGLHGQAPTVDRVGFPDGYEKTFQHLLTVDRSDFGQVRVIMGNDKAASVRPGEAFPYGSILIFEGWRPRRDAQNALVFDSAGRLVKDTLTTINVMRKEPGYGVEYQANRNGEWEYVTYRPNRSYATPPQNSAQCAICHAQAGTAKDYVFRAASWRRTSGATPRGVMQQFTFLPRVVRVNPGTTISWQNDDEEIHNIIAANGTWRSADLVQGSGFDLTFNDPGVYNFSCTIHPGMRGAVVVELPVLKIVNRTAAGRGTRFQIGDAWEAVVSNAAPLSPVYLRIVKDGVDLGVSGPYGDTDGSGNWSYRGTFTAGEVAAWQEQVLVGSRTSNDKSPLVSFSVEARVLSRVNP
jgi:plastocyanin